MLLQDGNSKHGDDSGGFIYYRYDNKRSLKIFVDIAQRMGEWFPVRSLNYSPENSSGSIVLVRRQDSNGNDETTHFGLKITPSSEGIEPPAGTMPFLSILPGGKGPSLTFNSVQELDERFLCDRQTFVKVMAGRLVPFTVPEEEAPPNPPIPASGQSPPKHTSGIGRSA